MRRAYLFDIDGTLLKVKHKVNRMVIQRILDRFGFNHVEVSRLDFAGKTDRDIFSGLLDQPDDELFHYVKQIYLQELERHITEQDIHIFSGVHTSLDYLRRHMAWTGLLTGNFARAAKIKLSRIGLLDRFLFGAYGDDDHDRNALPPSALQDLLRNSGKVFQPSDLVIIGDTPRDIECAKSFGSVSVAVSTGTYTHDELKACDPDIVLDSLQEFPEWNEQLLESDAKSGNS